MAIKSRFGRKVAGALLAGIIGFSAARVGYTAHEYVQYQKMNSEMRALGYPFANTGIQRILNEMHSPGMLKKMKRDFSTNIKSQNIADLKRGIAEMRKDVDLVKNFMHEIEAGQHTAIYNKAFVIKELKKALETYEFMLHATEETYKKKSGEYKPPTQDNGPKSNVYAKNKGTRR